jgi:uncharacterized protein YggE
LINRRFLLVAIAVAAMVAALLLGVALGRSSSESASAPRTITVTGSGSVEVVPDQGETTLGVFATAPTAAAAQAASDRKERRVIAALKARGVDAADIQTTDVSLSPNYSSNGRRIVGYTASNSVRATIRDLAESSTIIPAAVAAGANQVGGLVLSSSRSDALYGRQALAAAVADARTRAEALAAASGGELGQVRSVSESGSEMPVPYRAEAAQRVDTSTPVEPGTLEVTAAVTVVFELE